MRTANVLLILLISGIVLRIVAGAARPADLTEDNDGYLAHAETVANGEGFAGPFSHRPTAFRPPAFPIALAGLRISGLPYPGSVAVVNGLSSIAVIWLTWILCRQLQLPQSISIVATTLTTFDPLLVRYSVLPMTEVPATAMLMGAVVALKAAELQSDFDKYSCAGFRILSGVLFGLGSLARLHVLRPLI